MTTRTITTDATAQCEAMPDSATVEALAIGEGESASDTQAIANDRASTLRESITDVSTAQVRTVNLQVQDTNVFDAVTDTSFQAIERLQARLRPPTTKLDTAASRTEHAPTGSGAAVRR